MSNLKKLKKILMLLIIISAIIFVGSSVAKAVKTVSASGSLSKNQPQLHASHDLYCINEQSEFWFDPEHLTKVSETTITSDDGDVNKRRLAKIIYDGDTIEGGKYGGFNNYGPYQFAVWFWYSAGKGVNTEVSNEFLNSIPDSQKSIYRSWCATPTSSSYGGEHYQEGKNIYDATAGIASIPYSNSKASVKIEDFQMEGAKQGHFSISKLVGNVESVEVTWNNPETGKQSSYEKIENNGKGSGITFKNENGQVISIGNFKQGTIYLENGKTSELIASIKVNVKVEGSGYKVIISRYHNDGGAARQNLIQVKTEKGNDSTASGTTPEVEYKTGNLKLIKVGRLCYVDNVTGATEKIDASFKIYCTTLKQWVKGNTTGAKTFTTKQDSAGTYKSGTTVNKLYSGFSYEIVEVDVTDKLYAPIKLSSVSSNIDGTVKIENDGVYYKATGVNVYTDETNELTFTNDRQRTKLQIIKLDQEDKETKLGGFGIKIWVKYPNGQSSWMGSPNFKNATEFVDTDKDGIINIDLNFGTYYIYETKGPDDSDYDLASQDNYHIGPDVEGVEIPDMSEDWVYLGDSGMLDSADAEKVVPFYAYNKKSINLEIIKYDETKKDEDDKNLLLKGGEFKLYAVLKNNNSGWVHSLDEAEDKKYASDKDYKAKFSDATTYGSKESEDDNTKVIEKLKPGTYYLFETKAPEGYDLTKLEYYQKLPTEVEEQIKDESRPSDKEVWAYLDNKLVEGKDQKGVFKFEAFNPKIVTVEGYVWLDVDDGKEVTEFNNIYDDDESKLEGYTVLLKDKDDKIMETETTDANGHYSFTQKSKEYADQYSKGDRNIYYWDLEGAYVEFRYNNKTTYKDEDKKIVDEFGYIIVDPFVGSDTSINSKAKETYINQDKLNDEKLTGIEGDYPGQATTNHSDNEFTKVEDRLNHNKAMFEAIQAGTISSADQERAYLTDYYNIKNYKVENVNLGLKPQIDQEFHVEEYMDKVEFEVNGFSYKYNMGTTASKEEQIENDNLPVANKKKRNSKYYNQDVYPSEIAQMKAENSEESMRAFVYYDINIKDNQTGNKPDQYEEVKLKVEAIVNQYDSNRYELCASDDWEDANGTGVAKFVGTRFKNGDLIEDGIARESTQTVSIKFKIKPDALKEILNLQIGQYSKDEKKPTQALVKGYHEYLRTDNTWDSQAAKAYYGTAQEENSIVDKAKTAVDAKLDKQYYLHRSISKVYSGDDLYLKFQLASDRKIAGTVFEDAVKDEKTNLGDGIKEDNDNRAQNVKVELLAVDENNNPGDVAKLFTKANNENGYEEKLATITTNPDGTYEFIGVTPGYYYIRFTYGNGKQVLCDSKGNPISNGEIFSNDYKSTIISAQAIKDAKESKDVSSLATILLQYYKDTNTEKENDANYTTARQTLEWYKYLGNEGLENSYSTATDNLTSDKYELNDAEKTVAYGREIFNKELYYSADKDSEMYDENSEELIGYSKTKVNDKTISYPAVFAETPFISISINNDIDDNVEVSEPETSYSKPIFEGFNFGIIKQPDTKIELEKKITNVDFTSEVGTALVSASPKEKVKYMSALDALDGGSKYVKLELESSEIHGSDLITTYEIKVTNKSDVDYIEEGEKYGWYYKYGERVEGASAKKITIRKVEDTLDPKYMKIMDENGNEITETSSSNIVKASDNGNTIIIKDLGKIEVEGSTSITYKAEATISAQQDPIFRNDAEVTEISLDKLATLNRNFKWDARDKTILTITPPTGENKSNTYWGVGAIALVVMVAGIVVIKKKIL